MTEVSLACTGCVLYIPEPVPVISSESTFLWTPYLEGHNLDFVNTIFTKFGGQEEESQQRSPGSLLSLVNQKTVPPPHKPNQFVWQLKVSYST